VASILKWDEDHCGFNFGTFGEAQNLENFRISGPHFRTPFSTSEKVRGLSLSRIPPPGNSHFQASQGLTRPFQGLFRPEKAFTRPFPPLENRKNLEIQGGYYHHKLTKFKNRSHSPNVPKLNSGVWVAKRRVGCRAFFYAMSPPRPLLLSPQRHGVASGNAACGARALRAEMMCP
jgi:hypothetical protein